MVKPDGVQRGFVGIIISKFEQRGYQLCGLKMRKAPQDLLEKHYAHLKSKPYFAAVINHMMNGPVVSMVWQGKDVVKQGRSMLGVTNPLVSEPGSLRADYCIAIRKTACHGSDSVDTANAEIEMWFKEDEVMNYNPPTPKDLFHH